MLKIGIIGLGDIAQKAYLPVISQRNDIEIHLYTRDQSKLLEIASRYRFQHLHTSLESLISSGIQAAFVHTATASHEAIIEKLLYSNVHVYVDKPITAEFSTTKKLIELAQKKQRILFTGFNRRFAPAYSKLRSLAANMILMQKNRKDLPGNVRTFVFDDFIHVVDTLLFLFPHPVHELMVSGRKKDGLLYHACVQFVSPTGELAIGIMNRDTGTVEERLEIFTSKEKRVVVNVSEEISLHDKNSTILGINDWEPTLTKRGFTQIIDQFLKLVTEQHTGDIHYQDSLKTHQFCEEIVEKLNSLH
jgi:virulence factor